jgi:hypothetical protein
MRTRYLNTIALDESRLRKDLEHSTSLRFSEAYSNYLIGGPWKSLMLWANGGDSGDGVIARYEHDKPSSFTDIGEQFPYLKELIANTADLSRLSFVRLATFSNSVIMPHRDYLELNGLPDDVRSEHRVHICLATNPNIIFSEDNTVYRMLPGDVWFLDVARPHAVASLTNEPRTHLIFDFVGKPGDGPLMKVTEANAGDDAGIPASRRVERPPLTDADRASLMRLADVLTMDNFFEVFSIIIKKHFRADGGDGFMWDTFTAVAGACHDPGVLPRTLELRRYTMLDRAD